MMNLKINSLTLFVALIGSAMGTVPLAATGQNKVQLAYSPADSSTMRYRALHGATMQIDPTFPYYQHRSKESIAEEIELAGYKAVHYFVVNEEEIDGALIEAFHRRQMPVWLMVIGNGTYSTKGLPAGWEQWKMKLTQADNGSDFTFFSFYNPDFVAWRKAKLAEIVRKYPFDGIEMAECYFPEWDAIRTGRYGDVSAMAEAAFQQKYALQMPDFVNPAAANYYTKVPAIYEQWMQFRVETVNDFIAEIYNGKGGVREANPSILVATWSLGLGHEKDAPEKIHEFHGLDPVSLVDKIKPDVHYVQTHWPDWGKSEKQLPYTYAEGYKPFIAPLQAKYPTLPLAFQADQGSALNMVKSLDWVKGLNRRLPTYGYTTWTYYEYHLGGYIYEEAPKPKIATLKHDTLVISFDKRIDEESSMDKNKFKLYAKGKVLHDIVSTIAVDGNRAILTLRRAPKLLDDVEVQAIKDNPKHRLYKTDKQNTMDKPERLRVKTTHL